MSKEKNKKINDRHIEFYNKSLDVLEFLLNEFAHDIKYAEFEFLEIPKNTITTIDFLISAIGKVQKGHRLALGLDDENNENTEPQINIIEGLNEDKL